MKRLFVLLLFPFSIIFASGQSLLVTNLRCEYAQNPLGIDVMEPKLSWELDSKQRNVVQLAYHIMVADNPDLLDRQSGNMWDSKKVNSSSSIQVTYKGLPLQPAKKYYWKVKVWDNKGNVSAWSGVKLWQMGLFTKTDWQNAKWIAYDILPDVGRIVPFAHGRGKKEWGARKDISPLLRKNFSINKPVKNATVFISGLGHFEMSLNGEKTGDHFLDPGWTQYSKHALYVTFDISRQIKKGDNTIGVILGNGFYYIPGERYRKLTGGYGYPKMIARIVIEYADGSIDNIVSDESWKTTPSPVIFSSIYGGEDYDANLEQKGWATSSFNDNAWKKAMITDGPPSLQSQSAAPLRLMEKFTPVKKTQLKPSVWIYDLGQNFSGVPSITVSGKKNDTIRITPAELINEDGSANQSGSGGPFFFTYILKGHGKETWQPKFTYYGFRYLQVQYIAKNSLETPPQLVQLEGWHIRNAAEKAGAFSCSNTLFNKTYALIDWAIKSNMVSVFTDCPHREKLGWLEQNHLMGSSVQYNYDIASLCKKVIRDMINAQTPEGLVPEIAPEFVQFEDPFRDSPEWGSAAIIFPWYAYKWYGDKQIVAEAYEMMRRYINYLQKKAINNILSQGLGDWYDIGPKGPGVSQNTPPGVTATAIYYHDLIIMTRIATLLNKPTDAQQYKQLALAVKKSFNEKFYNSQTHQYASGSQTANAMALFMDLVEPAYRDSVLANLIRDIRSRNNALTAGDIGYRYVLRALEDAGRPDIIFDMNSRDDIPGYGYQLKHGATALTESWQAYPSVSNNHFMLGHLMEWFYSGLCGIRSADEAVAYNKIEIRPQPVDDISHASASYHSVYGWIRSGWKKSKGIFELKVTIPSNTTAIIYIPCSRTSFLTEGGKKMTVQVYKKGTAVLNIGSGNYTFLVKD